MCSILLLWQFTTHAVIPCRIPSRTGKFSDNLAAENLSVHCITPIFLIRFSTWRLATYRQFTWCVHGFLGRKNRRVIPACVVKAIRMEFPEEGGENAGFKLAEIEFS